MPHSDATPVTIRSFDLPERRAPKADPALIARDEQQFAAIEDALTQQIRVLTDRLDAQRKAPGGAGRDAMDRDVEIHRLSAELRLLRRYGIDLCLGRIVSADDPEPMYIGRTGLTDGAGRRLLYDWRVPAAEPFFAATFADPMGLASRRRYRWTRGKVTDYWDEVFTADGLEGNAALDDQSAFIASLGASRSPRMRDVLSTIAADQDAIIRAGSRGALVVDGGPGTGKTVVALHRAAYLLYSDPRLAGRRAGVLFVGPSNDYKNYVADVLPSLGEEGVAICTLRDLVPEGESAGIESDDAVAALKASAALADVIEPAVGFYEEPPSKGLIVETDWAEVWLSPADWAEAFDAPEFGTPHNEGRDQAWEALLSILIDKLSDVGDEASAGDGPGVINEHGTSDDDPDTTHRQYRRSLLQNRELAGAFNRAWPLLEAADLVGDLWSVPAYLRMCAPALTSAEVSRLQRENAQAWTESDLPLLDAARQRLGDPEASRRKSKRDAVVAAEREYMSRVVDDLIDADDSEMRTMSMLRGEDLQESLVDEATLPGANADPLAATFAHVVVDEAQELTDAEWRMLLRRCPSRSFTVVGDRAQARHGFTESWRERLGRIGLDTVAMAPLNINYRTPEEVMVEAEPVIRAAIPDANVPRSIRTSGIPVVHDATSELPTVLERWLAENQDGIACVIGDPTFDSRERVQSLSPAHAKGLEFDLVVLVDPEAFGTGIEGTVDRYVAMTRATRQLVIVTSDFGQAPS